MAPVQPSASDEPLRVEEKWASKATEQKGLWAHPVPPVRQSEARSLFAFGLEFLIKFHLKKGSQIFKRVKPLHTQCSIILYHSNESFPGGIYENVNQRRNIITLCIIREQGCLGGGGERP